jgi:hypothetical protein
MDSFQGPCDRNEEDERDRARGRLHTQNWSCDGERGKGRSLYLFLLKGYEEERFDVDETDLNFVLKAVRNTELDPPSAPEAARVFAAENRQLVRHYVCSLRISDVILKRHNCAEEFHRGAALLE